MKLTLKRDLPLLLAALLVIWGLWYARPVGVETLYPELEPDIIEVYLSDFNTYRQQYEMSVCIVQFRQIKYIICLNAHH